ncbi:putative malate dehydrogenase 1B [Adelges cooleyi]|uniref:putative malate dehydrogenase 1B n=1 Tax=Adelges cooleyi TaxID=133065 RepID=UPI00218058AE|nr:putative malate dehydrogenase 1B [Adelges cooleyi]
MFTYFIAGVPSCAEFGHAKLVAEKLKKTLPFFSYRVVVKHKDEYYNWLRNFCNKQKWVSNDNPFVWKRFGNVRGPCHMIGNISNFFDILNEYYNVDTHLDKRVKKHIAMDNLERLPLMLSEQKPEKRSLPKKVCITGATYPSTSYLVSELLQLKSVQTKRGTIIRLHHKDVKKYEDLMKIKRELSNIEGNVRGHNAIVVVNSIEEGLLGCDLLIVQSSIKREDNEEYRHWTKRNYDEMMFLSCILNLHCPKSCKILLMGMDLLCFNLNVLAENSETVHIYNFVGVTSHYGMEQLPTISRTLGKPVADLHCPPVWGFIGLTKHIDLKHTVYHTIEDSNNGTSNRAFVDCTDHKAHKYLGNVLHSIHTDFIDKKMSVANTNWSLNVLPETRAAISLISEWFEQKNNKTMCVAIFSDGTFNLPFGTFMSQPAYLENGEWRPNSHYPTPSNEIFTDVVNNVVDLLQEYNLGKRFIINLRESSTKLFE